jgi:hypothetical protein
MVAPNHRGCCALTSMNKKVMRWALLSLVAIIVLPAFLSAQRARHKEQVKREVNSALRDGDVFRRRRALDGLGRGDAGVTADVLLDALASPDAKLRYAAADVLITNPLRRSPRLAESLARHLRNDTNPTVRSTCVQSLWDNETPEALDAFIQGSRDNDVLVALQACIAIERRGGQKAIAALFAALSSPDWGVRMQACRSLIVLKTADARVVAVLEKLARQPEAKVFDTDMNAQRLPPQARPWWSSVGAIQQEARKLAAHKR